jgi:hypothetical protein
MMRRFVAFGSFLLFGLAACGGTAVFETEGAGGSGGSGSATSSSSTASGASSGQTSSVAATSTSTSTGVGGGPTCGRTYDAFELLVENPDGSLLGCGVAGGSQGTIDVSGAIVDNSDGVFIIDSCPPGFDCIPQLTKIQASAVDFFPYLWAGLFVRVQVVVDQPWGCEQRIVVRNLPIWAGQPNPYEAQERLFFAAADGVASSLPDSPVLVEAVPLGCAGAPYADDYLLRFTNVANPAQRLELLMGQEDYVPAENHYWWGRNLRSFETGADDDYWNWAYWLTTMDLDG